MADSGISKRTRQACEPCRRKKARCPGERPACSYCHRLGQRCLYSDTESLNLSSQRVAKSMNDRMNQVEGKLDQLLARFENGSLRRSFHETRSPVNERLATPHSDRPRRANRTVASDSSSTVRIRDSQLVEAANLYLTWCHKQPLALFDGETFMDSLDQRDPALCVAIKAVALPFSPAIRTPLQTQQLNDMLSDARQAVWQKMAGGEVELSSLQTLCLISARSFVNGQNERALIDLSMANHIAWSFRPANSAKDLKEYLDCTWSLAVLQYHQISVLPPLSFRESTVSPVDAHGKTSARSHQVSANARISFTDVADCQMSSGIQMVTAELGRVWQMARMYAAGCHSREDTPPWMPNSDFADVMVEHLRWETTVPRKYRYAANRFDKYNLADLHANRGYWSPWLHLQIVFAGIPCLLNHPFLLAKRLQDFRHAMPQSFIQQSYEQISRHAGWIMYFIDLIQEKTYQVVDPVVAHCVLIVATIHLQHSFVQDSELSHRSQVGFDKCLGFLKGMEEMIPIAITFAEKLETLQSSITMRGSTGVEDGRRQQLWSIDTSLLNDLLRYETAGRNVNAPAQSIQSKTLIPRVDAKDIDPAVQDDDFDLVGSAGISAHRTAPREAPINAPGAGNGGFTTPDAFTGASQPVTSNIFEEDGFGQTDLDEIMAAVADPMLFLPATDHFRSIDDWLNLNAG